MKFPTNPAQSLKLLFYSLLVSILLLYLSFLNCEPKIAKVKKRAVSLVPSITEIIFALGKDDCLVGNTIYCDYPEEAKKIYKVGDFSNPNLEKIVGLKPDIVFATMPEQKIIIERLKELKIPVFVSQPVSIDSMLKEIKAIGKILGVPQKGESLTMALATELDQIKPKNLAIPVYLEIAQTPLITVGGGSFINDVLNRAGGRNIFGFLTQEYPVIDAEAVIKLNPKVIFILHPLAKKEEVKKRIGWQKITAVKENRIYDDVNPDLIFRPGPRIVQGIKALMARISE
jgi:iron complex transport system substrate-binding protein|uniref:Cobalamin-binding protein n=1 Tax=candidate division WOR-3 bacterium TaxID=2052148 RepID=A0A7C6A964_UNCW3